MAEKESLENQIIRKLNIEILQTAMQTLTEIQKERLHLYFLKEKLPEK